MNRDKNEIICPLCNQQASPESRLQDYDTSYIECKRCACYTFSDDVGRRFERMLDRHLLSGITRYTWEQRANRIAITTKNVEELVARAPHDKDVMGKSRWLLRSIASKSSYPGNQVALDLRRDYPLACARSHDEFIYYLKHLENTNWIRLESSPHSAAVWLTPDGWDESDRGHSLRSSKAFVAIWFDESMRPAYAEAFEPALHECGYKSIRIDDKEFLEGVVDEIIAEIRESRFIVADLTGQRAGVYFEGGFAKGLGLPVIWTCREDDVDKVHFDTKHLNLLVWKTHNQLREKLVNRVRSTIGKGPQATDD